MAVSVAETAEPRVLPRSLAGATVLQIVPALRESPEARAALSTARALVRVGARAIVAGEHGPLVDELKSFGGEWLPFPSSALSRAKRRAAAAALADFLAAEGVHIVHARSAAAARCALIVAARRGIGLVTDLPDMPRRRMWLASFFLGVVSRGDRVISPSLYNARPMMARHRVPPERIDVVPRGIDLDTFDPARVPAERIAALRKAWGVPTGARIVLVPGRVSPRNGQLAMVRAARILTDRGMRGVTFVLVGDDRRHRHYVRKIQRQASVQGVDMLFRLVGPNADMPTAFAAADIVVVPYRSPPAEGDVVAEAQAMGRPVIATAVGPLPEYLLAPPHVGEGQRTGWTVPPHDPAALAQAIESALALDAAGFGAISARARKFSERMFAPTRAAEATLEVYTALLEARA